MSDRQLITVRNSSFHKRLSAHRRGMRSGGGRAWLGACLPRGMRSGGRPRQGACISGEMATATDGMHATGMHSCLKLKPNASLHWLVMT